MNQLDGKVSLNSQNLQFVSHNKRKTHILVFLQYANNMGTEVKTKGQVNWKIAPTVLSPQIERVAHCGAVQLEYMGHQISHFPTSSGARE